MLVKKPILAYKHSDLHIFTICWMELRMTRFFLLSYPNSMVNMIRYLTLSYAFASMIHREVKFITIISKLANVNSDGHIWGPGFNRYVCFLFRGNRTILAEIKHIPYLTLTIQRQGQGEGQILWSHLRHMVQSTCLLIISRQSGHFWPRYSEFHIWPSKFKVKFTVKVKSDGDIWGLGINRYVLFRGNRTILVEI